MAGDVGSFGFAMKTATTVLLMTTLAFGQSEVPSIDPPATAVKNENGLATIVLKEGSGEVLPTTDDFVTLDYTVWNGTGTITDSTAKHPDVRTFAVVKLFPGLRKAIESMKAGEKQRVWIPAELSPKKTPLVIDVELKEISRPLSTPTDVAAPPADAEKSRSGLAWKVLTPGDGSGKHPKRSSWVSVHYSGWTTDGKMFDSSYGRGEPSSFQLDEVIPGWTEGVQLMTVGEKRRFWIPSKLAYKGQRGMPKGMLVFDVELMRYR